MGVAVEEIVDLSPDLLRAHRNDLMELLADAIENGASVGYLLPLRREDLHAYWEGIESDVRSGGRTVLAILEDDRIVGSVQLLECDKPNQPHRADVQKLLVHSRYRQRGAGAALMNALERRARDRGRWLLVLDTRSASVADDLYPKWGWQTVGQIPDYALDPDGTPAACTFYWKRLA